MTDNPSVSPEVFDEMHRLVAASLSGEMSSEQGRRLEELVHQDAKTFDLYLNLVFESSILLTWAGNSEPRIAGTASHAEELSHHATPHRKALPSIPGESEACSDNTAGFSPIPSLLGNTLHGTAGFFSSGWPVAYLVATVVFGFGLLVGALVHVSTPVQIVQKAIPSPQPPAPSPSSSLFVGRITGMVDCRWSDPETEAFNGAHVPLGRRYALSSGLMEITYDTGAKVILQGPVTYEVESKAGGFLSVGKLTAKLEKHTEGSSNTSSPQPLAPSPPSNPQSLIPNPLFAVRTPTATVTDLGTEFGVEVSKEGDTVSHVFRGSVRVQLVDDDGKMGRADQVLHENESACVEAKGNQGDGNRIKVLALSVSPAGFVREIPKRTEKASVVFETIACWQFDGKDFLADSSGHGHTLFNGGATQIDDAASFDGKAIMSTVDSIDLTPYTRVRISWSSKAASSTANQILWEHGPNYNQMPGAMIAYREGEDGFVAIRNDHPDLENAYRLDVYSLKSDRWEDCVVEFDRTSAKRSGMVTVLKNGVSVGQGTRDFGIAPASFVNAVFHIGARDGLTAPFVGQIDNLKIEGATAAPKQ